MARHAEAKWTTAVTEARAHHSLLTLHGYCSSNCPTRTVRIAIKDFDRQLLAMVRTHGLRCPLCGSPLQCHGVMTTAEQREADNRQARISVNLQRYERDHPGEAVPLGRIGEALPDDGAEAVPFPPEELEDAVDIAREGQALARRIDRLASPNGEK